MTDHHRAGPEVPDRVVVRPPTVLVLIGAPVLGLLVVGLLAAVRLAVTSGNIGEPFGVDGLTPFSGFGSTLGLVLLLVLLWSLAALLTFRAVFTPNGVTTRFLWRRTSVGLDDMVRLQYYPERRPAASRRRPPRVSVLDDKGLARASCSVADANFPDALRVIQHWARQRPTLVQDNETRAALLAPDASGAT